MAIEGSDGIGRKTQAPWVRIHSIELSPSATTGYYVVIHFSTDGTRCFVTLGCGATKWDSDRGDLIPYSDEELDQKLGWARTMLNRAGRDIGGFTDSIEIGSDAALPKRFEKATILCRTFELGKLQEDRFLTAVIGLLEMLEVLYERHSQSADIPSSIQIDAAIDTIANPNRGGNRQGYGLTAAERRAVELQGMSITSSFLKAQGYTVLDTSARKPYDILARKGDEEIKVEVKATTSLEMNSVLMTSGEVQLHQKEAGYTALALVRRVELLARGTMPSCTGGELDFIYPWDISEWDLHPRAFEVRRKR